MGGAGPLSSGLKRKGPAEGTWGLLLGGVGTESWRTNNYSRVGAAAAASRRCEAASAAGEWHGRSDDIDDEGCRQALGSWVGLGAFVAVVLRVQ